MCSEEARLRKDKIPILTGILVALDGGGVSFELNDLADQLVPADLDELVHL